ncbi:MAG TPA: ABC transporter ATP-binding protein, partial [Dehalococcoidia bacterium]|nr:ABC transporter ATP-binding protein [Dehalococcoidia bacterium]
CLGLLSPTSGSLLVQGKRPGQQTRKETGVIFQESCLDPLMTVEETLRLHADMFGLGRAQADSRIAELLERFQLKERSRDQTRILSGGLRRRLELARALLPWPSIILLDEPTGGLDPDARADFWEHAHHVNQEGATLVIATHDMAEAERHCKTVAFMDKGRMVAQGAPSELRRDLKHDSIRLEWPTLRSETLEDIARLPGAGKVTVAPPLLHITVDNARTFLPQLFLLADDGICSIAIRESSLEDAYFQIVGRQAPQ